MEETINFGYIPEKYSKPETSRIAIIPVAYDGTSTWIKGAARGPEAIIDASANLELYDIETDSRVYLLGIFTENAIEAQTSVVRIIEAVSEAVGYHLLNNRFPVVIGGEHSVSVGAVKACSARHEELTVLQLDAHTDLRDEYQGSKYNHACVMARVKEFCPFVQVGIRSMDFSEKDSLDRNNVFFAEDIYDKRDWIEKVINRLSENVYVTIDLDVFDPSMMPSVGTPEPGGLFWYDVLLLLKALCVKKNVVGFDVVELCPNTGNKAADFLAAKLIYKFLSYKFGG
ncbi:MAG TPA: agmatinase [Planctomycetes bacterium]|nr:agmatinase [Planctomycetota bacterium]